MHGTGPSAETFGNSAAAMLISAEYSRAYRSASVTARCCRLCGTPCIALLATPPWTCWAALGVQVAITSILSIDRDHVGGRSQVLNHEPPNNSKAEQSFSNMLLNVRDKHKQVQANIAAGFSEMLRAGVPKWCVSFSVCLRLRVCLRVWACVCVRACVRVRACVSPCVIACARAWLAGERGADGTGGAERGFPLQF